MGQTPSHPSHDGLKGLPEGFAPEHNDSTLAQSGISATGIQGPRKASTSPSEVRGSRKEDQSKRKRKSSPTRGHATTEPPFSPRNDATETRPNKRTRTGGDAHNEDKENGYGVEHNKKSTKKGADLPKPVVEIRPEPPARARQQQSPKQTPKKPPKQAPKTPSRTPVQTPRQTPNSTKPNRAHGSAKKPTLTGFFTAAEIERLETFKLDFCNTNGLSGHAFDEMIQHSDRDKSYEFPCDSSIITKAEFWRNIYETMPQRDRRSVYRFMRRHFRASTQRPHEWTREQDNELVSLHTQHGPKWAYIAKLVGRSDDDVVQRWKNRLEHRNTMLRGPWTAEEIRALQSALNLSWKAMRDSGAEVGRDIYEMDETIVGWGQVSERMEYKRSRQQCADKWRRIRKRILDLRAKGYPDATYEPTAEMRSPKKPRTPVTVAQEVPKENRYKSSEYVEDDDSGPDTHVGRVSSKPRFWGPIEKSESDSDTGEPERNQTKPTRAQSSPKKRPPGGSSSSDSSDSDSESESGEPAHKRSKSADDSMEIEKNPSSGSESENGSSSGEESEDEDEGEVEESKPDEGDSTTKDRMSLDSIGTGDDEALDAEKATQNAQPKLRSSSRPSSESESEAESKSGSNSEPESKVQSDPHVQKPSESSSRSDSDSSSDDSDSDSESESEADAGSEAKAGLKLDTAQKSASKADSSSESDSDSDSESKAEAEAVPQKPQQASGPEDTSDSESESDSGSEADDESNPDTVQKPAGQTDSESDSDSDSEPESDSSSAKSRSRSHSGSPSRSLNKQPSPKSPKTAIRPESDSESTSSSGSDSDSDSSSDSGSDSDSDSSSNSSSGSEDESESNKVKEESRSGSENTFRFIKKEDISD